MGWSVSKIIIIILSFRVGSSKIKNIDHGVTETFAIVPSQVTYEIDHVSLPQESTISSALNVFYVSYCNL